MKIQHFLKKAGLKYTQDEIAVYRIVPQVFTKSGVYKAVEEIKRLANKSDSVGYRAKEIEILENAHTDDPEGIEDITLRIPLKKRLNKELDQIFEEEIYEAGYDIPSAEDFVDYVWLIAPRKRYWYFMLSGREICYSNFRNIIQGKQTHDDCPAPKEFKSLCSGVISILKKYAVE